MKRAYLFIERNFGSGYGNAYPPMNPFQAWWLRNRVLPVAEEALRKEGRNESLTGDGFPPEGIVSRLPQCTFYNVHSLLIQPDPLCTDPRARGPKFVLHIVLPPNLKFASYGFRVFFAQCCALGWSIRQSGEDNRLRIPVPADLYEQNR